jgi:alpha-beta hydrolase superfamily lysophospholipase
LGIETTVGDVAVLTHRSGRRRVATSRRDQRIDHWEGSIALYTQAEVEIFQGNREAIAMYVWPNANARHIVILAHGYGEHLGRYQHVADFLIGRGAVVAGPDHVGHGRSGGERVVVTDYELVVDDLHSVATRAKKRHPGLALILVGHSMGGMIGARYAQLHGEELAGLVLSGPVLGSWTAATDLLELDEIPNDPLDVSTLSRDPSVGEVYGDDELVWHGPFKRPTLVAIDSELETISSGPKLGPLPTLWLHGEEDQLVPISETRTGMEALEFTRLEEVIYPGARHEVFNETNKDEVLARTADFIDRVTG